MRWKPYIGDDTTCVVVVLLYCALFFLPIVIRMMTSNNKREVIQRPFTTVTNVILLIVNGYLTISISFSYTTTFGWIVQVAAFYNIIILLIFDAYGMIQPQEATKEHDTRLIKTKYDVFKTMFTIIYRYSSKSTIPTQPLKEYCITTRPYFQCILIILTFTSSIFVMAVAFGGLYFDCNSWGSIININTSSQSIQTTEIYFDSIIKPLGLWAYCMTDNKFNPPLPAPLDIYTSIEMREFWFRAQYKPPKNSSEILITQFTTTMESTLCTESFIYIKPCYMIKNQFYYENDAKVPVHESGYKIDTKKEKKNPTINIFSILLLFPTVFAIGGHLLDDFHIYTKNKQRRDQSPETVQATESLLQVAFDEETN